MYAVSARVQKVGYKVLDVANLTRARSAVRITRCLLYTLSLFAHECSKACHRPLNLTRCMQMSDLARTTESQIIALFLITREIYSKLNCPLNKDNIEHFKPRVRPGRGRFWNATWSDQLLRTLLSVER